MRALALLVIAGLMLASAAAAAESRFIELHARKFAYEPNIIRVQKGDTVTIRLVSEDVSHGFYLDGYELEMHVAPGGAAELTFVADRTGKYTFRCSVTCGEFHPYMAGNLIVEPNTRFHLFVALTLLIGLLAFLVPLLSPLLRRHRKEAGPPPAEGGPRDG